MNLTLTFYHSFNCKVRNMFNQYLPPINSIYHPTSLPYRHFLSSNSPTHIQKCNHADKQSLQHASLLFSNAHQGTLDDKHSSVKACRLPSNGNHLGMRRILHFKLKYCFLCYYCRHFCRRKFLFGSYIGINVNCTPSRNCILWTGIDHRKSMPSTHRSLE